MIPKYACYLKIYACLNCISMHFKSQNLDVVLVQQKGCELLAKNIVYCCHSFVGMTFFADYSCRTCTILQFGQILFSSDYLL